MGVYGMALRAGLQGVQDGQDRQFGMEARRYGLDRQKTLDQQADQRFAQQQQDYQEFQRPQMQREARAGAQQDAAQEKMRAFHEAYISHDPAKAAQLYNEMVPDGYTANIIQTGQDEFEIQHPNGRSKSNWDALFFGKEDGTGLGLFQLIDPMGTLKAGMQQKEDAKALAKEQRDQTQEIQNQDRQHRYRLNEIGASAAANRANAMLSQGEPFKGDDGNLYILRPDGSTQPVMNNGQPMKAPQYGMGIPRASAGGVSNPFGNSAKSQERWTRANMLAAGDPTGQLKQLLDNDPYAVANLVEQFDQAGANRSARMKIARDMVKQAASGMGETMTAQEINARATELMTVIDSIAGPQPAMPGAAPQTQTQTQGSGMPNAGDVIDGYRFRGGDPNNQANWEPVQ